MDDKVIESWRARAAVSEALDVFNSNYMQEVWSKALARRQTDPEGAVTSARTLLETVCKHILDDAGKEYPEGAPLPKLYKRTADVLEVAPTEHTAPILTALFESCAGIVESVGMLRNHLSDSHGRGPFGTMPDWRHAELAVNLSAAMATYLAAIWKGRQPTVADAIKAFLDKAEKTKPLGLSHRLVLELMARSPIGSEIASKLQLSDLVGHCEFRRARGISPTTLLQDITYLKGALGDRYAPMMDQAIAVLRAQKIVAKPARRGRRIRHEEYDALIKLFREQDKRPKNKIPMAVLMEFAVWSGRPISQICSMRWSDVDFEKRTCRLPETDEEFPLFDKAWEILTAQPRKDPRDKNERIFPYNSHSASARHTAAKNQLKLDGMKDLRFHDLRHEAISRLLESGHPPHEVARATGLSNVNLVTEIYREIQKAQRPQTNDA